MQKHKWKQTFFQTLQAKQNRNTEMETNILSNTPGKTKSKHRNGNKRSFKHSRQNKIQKQKWKQTFFQTLQAKQDPNTEMETNILSNTPGIEHITSATG